MHIHSIIDHESPYGESPYLGEHSLQDEEIRFLVLYLGIKGLEKMYSPMSYIFDKYNLMPYSDRA